MLRNSTQGYGLISIFFHWICALTVIGLFALGTYVVHFGYASLNYLSYAHLHYALGIIIFVVFILRILWRLINTTPAPLDTKILTRLVIGTIKFLLYLLVFIVIVSGYFICTSEGQSIDVFGIFNMPSLMLLENEGVNAAGLIHRYGSWLLAVIITVHILGALMHHFVLGDNTLKRMINPRYSKNTNNL